MSTADAPARVTVRAEESDDHVVVAVVQQAAHQRVMLVALVEDLRPLVIPGQGCSLVAESGNASGSKEVVGHVMLTPAVLDAPPRLVTVQVLSPIGVIPSCQGRGVGAALVRAALASAEEQECPVVFLEGDPGYYARFGFAEAGSFGFRKPSLRIPDPAFQCVLLSAHEPWMTGTLVYPEVFWRHDAVGLRDRKHGSP